MSGTKRTQPPDEAVETALATGGISFQPYPWTGIEKDLRSKENSRLMLVGYGSLLNPASARVTIKDTPRGGHEPIVAYGALRVFDYIMPPATIARYGVEHSERERAALNTVWTARPEDMLNARLVPVSLDDFDELRERERGYHLGPVVYRPWTDPSAVPQLGFVLCATGEPIDGKVWVDPSLLPYRPYLELCREGCRQVDGAFEQMFLETTYLGDRATRLDQFLSSSE